MRLEVPSGRVDEVVNWSVLCRDRTTAESYINHTVRVRLKREEYQWERGVLRVWLNDRTVPPALLIEGAPECQTDVTVEFTVTVVTTDGARRSPWCDFFVTGTARSVTAPGAAPGTP